MKLKLAVIGAVALTLTACARPAPTPVNVQPSFDKSGAVFCPGGYGLATTTDGATVCQPL